MSAYFFLVVSSVQQYAHFQFGFLSILFFLGLFTFFQYLSQERKYYLFYMLYILATWLYFLKTFPDYLLEFNDFGFVSNIYEWLKNLREKDDYTEIIFFSLMVSSYLFFIQHFFDLKEKAKSAYKYTTYTTYLLWGMGGIQILAYFFANHYCLPILMEVIVKCLFLGPALWLIHQIIKAKLPGRTFIILGSGLLLISCTALGVLHFFMEPVIESRIIMQIGVLAEMLCFSAALGFKNKKVFDESRTAKLRNKLLEIEKEKFKEELDAAQRKLNRHKKKLFRQKSVINEYKKKIATKYIFKLKPVEETFEQKLNRIMSENYGNPEFKVSNLIEAMGADIPLYRMIKQMYGVSIMEYMMQYRIEKAKTFMGRHELNLNQISIMVGFQQYEHFSAIFKKRLGISPREYRKMLG